MNSPKWKAEKQDPSDMPAGKVDPAFYESLSEQGPRQR